MKATSIKQILGIAVLVAGSTTALAGINSKPSGDRVAKFTSTPRSILQGDDSKHNCPYGTAGKGLEFRSKAPSSKTAQFRDRQHSRTGEL